MFGEEMRTRLGLLFLAVLVLVVATLACGESTPEAPASTEPPAIEAQPTEALGPTYTPAPTDTPEPTEAPTNTPAPQPLALGNVFEHQGYLLCALVVEDPATKPGIFYEPEAGKKLVAVEFIVGNVSGEQFSSNVLYTTMIDAEGFASGAESGEVEGSLELLDVNPGEKVRGWAGFIVPEGSTPAILKYEFGYSTALQVRLTADGEQAQEVGVAEPTEVPLADTPVPTEVPATDTPAPTPTQGIVRLVKEGTHLIGTDIEPGIYVGLAGQGLMDSCYWARLSNLTGSDDVLANDNAQGLYYIEVLSDDKALNTACDLVRMEQIPERDEFLTVLPPGTYLVGRDIEAGTYRGQAGTDFLESCYWARLSNVSGSNDILANDNATGEYYVEVLSTDFALQVGCEVEKAE